VVNVLVGTNHPGAANRLPSPGWHRVGEGFAGPAGSELGMARLNHDVLATEVRYALADLTTMSMAELETLAHLLA